MNCNCDLSQLLFSWVSIGLELGPHSCWNIKHAFAMISHGKAAKPLAILQYTMKLGRLTIWHWVRLSGCRLAAFKLWLLVVMSTRAWGEWPSQRVLKLVCLVSTSGRAELRASVLANHSSNSDFRSVYFTPKLGLERVTLPSGLQSSDIGCFRISTRASSKWHSKQSANIVIWFSSFKLGTAWSLQNFANQSSHLDVLVFASTKAWREWHCQVVFQDSKIDG